MKKQTFLACLLLACLVTANTAFGIVGYYTKPMYPGDNFIANQLDSGNNTINNLLRAATGGVPDGASFTKWNPISNTYLPLSIYTASSDQWSINYSLNLGEGGLLNSSLLFTNIFQGTLVTYTNILDGFGGPGWHPSYSNGLYLISCPVPLSSPISSMFSNVVDRSPSDGEWVKLLNPATQTYTISTYHTGSGWDNGDPLLKFGESAFFNLGPVAVPEPATFTLFALGTIVVVLYRRKNRNTKTL